ncbi:HAMP domain-containing protein [Cyanobacterium stanieri LEGE 03274]|uniref:HAMP domain-containing protein n=1 Tax=Cyanobacterium stanieri LEGE 03274 TaxID=1828756 RepID=A0ABR9V4R9_9CHRO|nr:HAMP domain-containing methyl-accepting chemotaxis protein [Cyanobacterium stanieri]MBE9222885.1 HAMP domain-containing protein [Cyanobacterium stanieri LEGE 03274]
MASETDYQKRYTQAQNAYLEGNLPEARDITDILVNDYPEDPAILLLKGHICLQQDDYDNAKHSYQKVLQLSDRPELINLANQGLEQIDEQEDNIYPVELENPNFGEEVEEFEEREEGDNWTNSLSLDNLDWDPEDLEEEDIEDPTLQQNPSFTNQEQLSDQLKNPFDTDQENDFDDDITATNFDSLSQPFDFDPENPQDDDEFEFGVTNIQDLDVDVNPSDIDYDNLPSLEMEEESEEDITGSPTFVVSSQDESSNSQESDLVDLEEMLTSTGGDFLDDLNDDDYGDYSSALEPLTTPSGSFATKNQSTNIEDDDDQPLAFGDDEKFFLAPDDLDDIPDISSDSIPSSIFPQPQQPQNNDKFDDDDESSFSFNTSDLNSIDLGGDDGIGTSASFSPYTSPAYQAMPSELEVHPNKFSKYYNLSSFNKQLFHGLLTGVVSFVAVLLITSFQGGATEGERQGLGWGNKFILGLLTGIAAGGTTAGAGLVMAKHVEHYTNDLQNQFDSIYQGNYDVKTSVYSQDEFGTLASSFNHMAKMIKMTTTEAKKRAEDTEKAREDFQKQVVKFLDDVEGAARGDLTVQAEVTSDVLGAVADAFNLIIKNVRTIVIQVKQAAIQVNKGSTDSEVFARSQSSDALRMAEELAVTLNSVQMMTDSIQRVAENAREAEEVARSSSVTALKGGDAVERTVAGILQIRETVSETTRKVKRLAEASQKISTIVAVISNIASRTNLLALNASVQAARAGEAGRGFSIVAAEVRQLADRSAKSLQEIEQIVLQIQTETGSVMTAMEEGIQQVMDVTRRSEDAKRSLEDIIQVANRIDALVRSITADTDEQRENSKGVAKVMQNVELTAQETSQESQRVAGSLQNLVTIARDLLSSVDMFKVE